MKSVIVTNDYEYDKWLLKQRDTVEPEWAQPIRGGNHVAMPPCDPPGLSDELTRDSSIAKSLETVGGTVSRKGRFGFTDPKCCDHIPTKGLIEDWVPAMYGRYLGMHLPKRCKRCKARMKRYTCAARNYDRLELLRILRGRPNLKFVTWTRPEWNVILPLEQDTTCKSDCTHNACKYDHTECNGYQSKNTSDSYLWEETEKLKRTATRQFRNWRNRNKYWKSREATGQCYYEVTMKPVWKGWGWDEIQLHFHIHSVICSKRIENQDIQIDLDTLEQIPMSTTIQREWGGIVDVRKCRTWKHKDEEVKTSKRFVIRYLVDYITKSPHWQSTKFGDWSS